MKLFQSTTHSITSNNIPMEEIPDYVQPDVFQHPSGLVYQFCSGWKLVLSSLQEDSGGVSLAPESEPKLTSVCLAIPGSYRGTGTGGCTAPQRVHGNPYDCDHPEYNNTNPAKPYFVASGWISGTTTAASSVSTGPPALLHSPAVRNVPVLSNYCVLDPSDMVPVGVDGSHPLFAACEYGMWVKRLLACDHRSRFYGQYNWWHR